MASTVRTAVVLPDVNLLFAAHRVAHEHHRLALEWLRVQTAFATCATTELGLVRLLSNPVVNPGATTEDALAALARVRSRRAHQFWTEASSLGDPAIDVSRMAGHQQVTDFHLVNLAARNAGVLATLDAKIAGSLASRDRVHVLTLTA